MKFDIKTEDFQYELPTERIAKYPLEKREQAKLLVYNKGIITHKHFTELPTQLPENATLFFNNTKVISARLIFRKKTGVSIEVFLLNPFESNQPIHLSLRAKSPVTWKCIIGNLKRWQVGTGITVEQNQLLLQAKLINSQEGIVEFQWKPEDLSFGEVVEIVGSTPLPPYLNRKAEAIDKNRYQTVYSANEGAVAAPTAGLHFSDSVLKRLQSRGLAFEFLTLHVNAGTFRPIKTINAFEHPMHSEQILIYRKNIESMLEEGRMMVAVGTTSMRNMESIYWYGVRLLNGDTACKVGQSDPYIQKSRLLPCKREALLAVLSQFGASDELLGETSIYIVPGYEFKVCSGLITNFHQPGSTLMLLVAAFIGPDWKSLYHSALRSDYRFLSYGDSSLLIP